MHGVKGASCLIRANLGLSACACSDTRFAFFVGGLSGGLRPEVATLSLIRDLAAPANRFDPFGGRALT